MPNETVRTEGSLTIARRFRTSPERLYACWTEREHLLAWSGPPGFTSIIETLEPVTDGRHLATVQSPEGVSMRVGGVYKVAEPGRRLVFTQVWYAMDASEGPETTAMVTFVRREGGTLMVFHQSGFVSDDSRDGHVDGWTASFQRLNALVMTRSADPAQVAS